MGQTVEAKCLDCGKLSFNEMLKSKYLTDG
jgi:hypothetical protein